MAWASKVKGRCKWIWKSKAIEGSPSCGWIECLRNKVIDMDEEIHGNVVGVETRLISGGGCKAFSIPKEDLDALPLSNLEDNGKARMRC